MKQRDILWIFFLLFLGTLLYWNSLKTPFIWDEDALIVFDPRVHHGSLLPEIFNRPFLPSQTAFTTYYRPLATLSFRIDYLFWGLSPLGYHITNLSFHLLNTLLVYALFLIFFKDSDLSFLGTLFFLTHPAHVEAVTYIPSRTDVLSFFFFLASFHSYLLGRRRPKKFWPYLLSVLCYGLALLSKERATFLPLLIFGHMLLINREKTKFKGAEGILLLGLFFCVGSWAFVKRSISPYMSLSHLLDIPRLPLRLLVLPEILFSYAKIWFFPWPLHLGRVIPVEVLKLQRMMLEWSGFLFLLSGALFFFRKNRERFWLVWIAVALLPVVQIFPIYMNSSRILLALSEYLLYFATAGVVGLLVSRFGSHLLKSIPLFCLGIVLILFSFLVIWRNGEYRSRITLFEQAVRHAPWHAIAYNQIGLAYHDAGDPESAEKAFQKAVSLEPKSAPHYMGLGLLAFERGEIDKAAHFYRKAFELTPRDSEVLYNLGLLELYEGKWREGLLFLEEAIKINRYASPMTYNERTHAYWKLEEKEKALQSIEEALKVHPSSPMLQKTKRWLQERL